MGQLYERWCNATREKDKRKRYWAYIEKDGGRDEIRNDLAEAIRSHYDRLDRIADDVKRLGYKVAASILSEAMPQTPKGRSGDLGEILATELVEEEIGLRVPVRRLRYKDGRNMAMRGDDFIGAGYDGAGEKLWLLKGEAKSNKVLGKATVTSARQVLIADLAAQLGVHRADISRILPLAFLSPAITEAILTGRQPADLTARTLSRLIDVPPAWADQAAAFGT